MFGSDTSKSRVALLGNGAISGYVQQGLAARGVDLAAILVRPNAVVKSAERAGTKIITSISELPASVRLVIDCAGHSALRKFGPESLRSGRDLVTVSIGALAEQSVEQDLQMAALKGRSTLYLASGAIGALDTLRAARAGRLEMVRYVGRKPPKGWIGSPAEGKLDLTTLTGEAQTHFEGSARQAALAYPKNANVAAAVALSGLGFDQTEVCLIADPQIDANIHEIHATGDFGTLEFRIAGQSLPDNPRSSALAAMSVLAQVDQITGLTKF